MTTGVMTGVTSAGCPTPNCRGISKASANRLAFRRKWKRQDGNDGTARVAVPLSEISPKRPDIPDDTPDIRDDSKQVIIALNGQISAQDGLISSLREQIQRERAASEAQVAAVQAHIDTLARELRETEARLAVATKEAEARRSLGLLARLRAALRGENV
jgi:hypothetical protein